ncbi:MAG: bifunctional enoyl-CoA hydratase/phosphate acetyltransferase [Jhaorihella sp.]
MQMIENRTYDELSAGDSAELTRVLSARDADLFAIASGDADHAEAGQEAPGDIGHGMWVGALISAALGTRLPGPGTVYLDQRLRFLRPVRVGDAVTVRVRVLQKLDRNRLRLECNCLNGNGETVVEGEALVAAPSERISRAARVMPQVEMRRPGATYDDLVDKTRDLDPILTAVVHPCDERSLRGALKACELGLMVPILIGPRTRIEAAAEGGGMDISGLEIVDTPHSHAAARAAVDLAREGRAEALMKGALHTDEVMAEAVDRATGLRTERRMSHVFALDVPSHTKPLFVTDAAINIAPDLATKADIVQNAIDLAHALGQDRPRVAILSAVETVYPKVPSTVEAAALCKMADRRQITGGLLDGPLAFDNAISPAAAAAKGIDSPVAGQADILVVPDLESGNMIAKQMIYLAGAQAAGIVLGARVPIMLTSRADDTRARVASAALALLMRRFRAGKAR